MDTFLALLFLLLSSHLLLGALRPAGVVEGILVFFCIFSAQIIGLGNLLSAMDRLGDVRHWALLGLIAVLVSTLILWGNRRVSALPGFKATYLKKIAGSFADGKLSLFEKSILTPLALTAALLGIANLAIVLFSAPHHWDGLTYHLARMAYYLQHNDLNYFEANYWAQIVHPKNSSLLLLYTYLVSGRNENLTQLVQFISYWVAVCSVYAISMKTGNSKSQGLFAALTGALLTGWLMQATTTQNDLVLTACLGTVVYFILAFRESGKRGYLGLAAVGIGLSLGTKASALLPLLSAAVIVAYALLHPRDQTRNRLRDFGFFAASTLVAVCVFTLPAGYLGNYQRYGHVIGPPQVRELHSFEGESLKYIARNGTLNLVRYGFEFLSLDGLPAINGVREAQTLLKWLPEKIVLRMGIDLEDAEAMRGPFKMREMPIAHEDRSYWGILGFGLVWIAVVLSAVGVVKQPGIRVLAWAAILFLLLQAYAGPYDPWRGRYFTAAAIFALPAVGACLRTKNLFLRACLFLVVAAGCISAVTAVAMRDNGSLIPFSIPDRDEKSIFSMDRLEQLTRNKRSMYEPIVNFERVTPRDAVVAVFLGEDSPEYPLFGEGLTRTLIAINPFDKGLQPIPDNAEYLLYADDFPCADPRQDIHLGADWYLRKLTGDNRKCP